MRCFVAIELPAPVRAAVAAVQAGVRARAPRADVRWVDPAALHLTLKFLGELPEGRVPAAVAALEEAAGRTAALPLVAGGLGAFPSLTRARVVWIGVAAAGAALADLAGLVDRALASLGVPAEARPFHGHVTLGRVRSPRGARDLVAAVAAAGPGDCGGWTAGELVLFASRLRPTGATHTALARVPLGRADV